MRELAALIAYVAVGHLANEHHVVGSEVQREIMNLLSEGDQLKGK